MKNKIYGFTTNFQITVTKMRLLILIIIIFICQSCKRNSQIIEKDLNFEARKYFLSLDEFEIFTPDRETLDLKSLALDSIVEYPKHLYFEGVLSELREVRKILEENDSANRKVIQLAIDKWTSKIDSVNSIYKRISHSDKYYKGYFSVQNLFEDEEKAYLNLILNEKYKVIDHFSNFDLAIGTLELE